MPNDTFGLFLRVDVSPYKYNQTPNPKPIHKIMWFPTLEHAKIMDNIPSHLREEHYAKLIETEKNALGRFFDTNKIFAVPPGEDPIVAYEYFKRDEKKYADYKTQLKQCEGYSLQRDGAKFSIIGLESNSVNPVIHPDAIYFKKISGRENLFLEQNVPPLDSPSPSTPTPLITPAVASPAAVQQKQYEDKYKAFFIESAHDRLEPMFKALAKKAAIDKNDTAFKEWCHNGLPHGLRKEIKQDRISEFDRLIGALSTAASANGNIPNQSIPTPTPAIPQAAPNQRVSQPTLYARNQHYMDYFTDDTKTNENFKNYVAKLASEDDTKLTHSSPEKMDNLVNFFRTANQVELLKVIRPERKGEIDAFIAAAAVHPVQGNVSLLPFDLKAMEPTAMIPPASIPAVAEPLPLSAADKAIQDELIAKGAVLRYQAYMSYFNEAGKEKVKGSVASLAVRDAEKNGDRGYQPDPKRNNSNFATWAKKYAAALFNYIDDSQKQRFQQDFVGVNMPQGNFAAPNQHQSPQGVIMSNPPKNEAQAQQPRPVSAGLSSFQHQFSPSTPVQQAPVVNVYAEYRGAVNNLRNGRDFRFNPNLNAIPLQVGAQYFLHQSRGGNRIVITDAEGTVVRAAFNGPKGWMPATNLDRMDNLSPRGELKHVVSSGGNQQVLAFNNKPIYGEFKQPGNNTWQMAQNLSRLDDLATGAPSQPQVNFGFRP